jgi:GNAT superfamily N-acetyltransferase
MPLEFPTRAERPGKLAHADSLAAPWPEFMYHDPVMERFFRRVIAGYAEFQFYLWDDEREEVVGVGNAIPAAWDGDRAQLPDGGVDAVVEARFAEGATTPTVLCALQILIAPECRGQGLSSRMIEPLCAIGRAHGLDTLIAPVRPTLKHRYPLTPIENYIAWRRPDGTLLDPWLRTHERLGAEIARVAPSSASTTSTSATPARPVMSGICRDASRSRRFAAVEASVFTRLQRPPISLAGAGALLTVSGNQLTHAPVSADALRSVRRASGSARSPAPSRQRGRPLRR